MNNYKYENEGFLDAFDSSGKPVKINKRRRYLVVTYHDGQTALAKEHLELYVGRTQVRQKANAENTFQDDKGNEYSVEA